MRRCRKGTRSATLDMYDDVTFNCCTSKGMSTGCTACAYYTGECTECSSGYTLNTGGDYSDAECVEYDSSSTTSTAALKVTGVVTLVGQS